jgi:poly(beta-D-mannuronate) lyase
MKRLLLLNYLFFSVLLSNATTITVKNIDELNAANKKALPGDTVILQNGEWKNITIKLSCNGTEKNPIVFRSQTAGKVIITGNSKLKLGGNYIVVNGLFFKNGYAGDDAVISFRIDSKQLANNCRVTNTVIDDFNNPKRMDENNWVLFYGKNNQLDRCSFKNKKNMGVLLAVILDDDRKP